MKYTLLLAFINIVIFTLFVQSSFAQTNIYELCDNKNIHPKKEILRSIENESNEIKALVLSVAGIETENFTVDYPLCDNKNNKSCNIGIFKINIALVETIIERELDKTLKESIINDRAEATRIFVKGIKKLGKQKMLLLHRGGEGWKKFKKDDINKYIDAVNHLQQKWLGNEEELNSATTSCLRYSMKVSPI